MSLARVRMRHQWIICLLLAGWAGLAADGGLRPWPITLQEAQRLAVEHNLRLKIEQLNPTIARLTLRAAHGAYDPLLSMDLRRENLTDSGGFDPADFSKDAVYSAESHTFKLGVAGRTPMGLTYFLGADYANSFGERNYTFFDSYNINADFGLSQPLLRDLWMDQPRLIIQLSRKHLKVTELAVSHTLMDLLCQVQQAYYELMYAGENLAVSRQLQATRAAFLQAVQRQAQGGQLSAADVNLAQGQLAATRAATAQAQETMALAEHQLRQLMGQSFALPFTNALAPAETLICVPQITDYSQSCRQALARRADLRWLRLEAEKAAVDLKFRYNQLFPSLNLVAGWRGSGAHTVQDFWIPPKASSAPAFGQMRRGDSPSHMAGLVLTVPLSRAAERANYRLSKERRDQAWLLVRQQEEQVMREVADAVATLQHCRERLDALRDAVGHAREVLAAEEKRLAGGKSTVLFVLQFQAELARARAAELRAKADYNQACSRLRFAEGAILEASGLDLEVKP